MVSGVYDSVTQIRAEAARLDPVKVFLTLFLLPFYVLGWSARILWVAVSLAVAGTRHGWRAASAQLDARAAAAAGTG